MTKLGLETLGLKEIVIKAEPGNIGSNKVAEKAGYILVDQITQDGALLNVWSTGQE